MIMPGKKYEGWITVTVKHPQATNPYYTTRMWVRPRTRKEIKDEVFTTLMQSGDSLKFLKECIITIEK
jgi:hypothetical protein